MSRWIGGGSHAPEGDVVLQSGTPEITLSTSDGGTTYRNAGVSFGTAHATRSLVLAVSFNGGPITLASITIGGVTASVIETLTNGSTVYLAHARVPSGSSGAVVMTLGVAASITPDAAIFRCRFLRNIAAISSGHNSNSSNTVAMSVSLAVQNKSVVVAVGSGTVGVGESPSVVWTGVNGNNPSALTFSGRIANANIDDVSANATYPVTLKITNSRAHAMAAAAFR